MRRELDGKRSRQGKHCPLRRGVGILRDRTAEDRDEAGDVDDRSAMTLDHLGNGVLAGEIHASNVDGHDLIPGLDRRVDDRMVGLRHDPGVVVEDVEAAVLLDRQVHHQLRVGLDRHVD